MQIRELFQSLFHFRNVGHESWFYITMLIVVIFSIISLLSKRDVLMRSLAYGYLGISIVAAFHVATNTSVNTYSVDCIWFNALIAGLCYVAHLAIKKSKHKAESQNI